MGKALKLASLLGGGYLVLGLAYIVASSAWAAEVATNVGDLHVTETAKGVGFIVVTALLLFGFSAWLFGRVERAAAELSRERERLLLSERRAMVGTLAAAVAHDFNNLLTALGGDAEMLKQADLSDSERAELVANVQRALGAANDLSRRLTDAARGRRASSLQPVLLGALVRDTTRLLRGHAMLRGCRVELDVADVPGFSSDPVVLLQILTNLLLNAGEATASKGQIRIVVRADAEAMVLEVHDDGPGFGDGDVFAPFVSTRERDSGLGLLSVKSGVELLGGTVSAAASPLGGALVTVRFPRAA